MTIQPSAAFDLRETGLSFADVGKQLGCTKQNAMSLVAKHAKAIGREPVLAKPVVNPGTRIGGSGTWASGPARGEEPRGQMAENFEPGNQAAVGPHDFSKSQWREYMIGVYQEVAADTRASRMERMIAADKYLNREEGLPIARNLNADTDAAGIMAPVIYLPSNGRENAETPARPSGDVSSQLG